LAQACSSAICDLIVTRLVEPLAMSAERVAEVQNNGLALMQKWNKRKQDLLDTKLPEALQNKLGTAPWKAFAGKVNRRLKMELKEQIKVERKWKVAVTALKAGWVTTIPGNLIFGFWAIWQPAEALPLFFTGVLIAIALVPITWFVKTRLSATHEKILQRSQTVFDACSERNPSGKDISLTLQEVEPIDTDDSTANEIALMQKNILYYSLQMGQMCPLFFFLMFFAHVNPCRAVMVGPRTEIPKQALEALEKQAGMKGVALLAEEIVGEGEDLPDGEGDLGDIEMEDYGDVLDIM